MTSTSHEPTPEGRDGFHPVHLGFEWVTHRWTPWKASLPSPYREPDSLPDLCRQLSRYLGRIWRSRIPSTKVPMKAATNVQGPCASPRRAWRLPMNRGVIPHEFRDQHEFNRCMPRQRASSACRSVGSGWLSMDLEARRRDFGRTTLLLGSRSFSGGWRSRYCSTSLWLGRSLALPMQRLALASCRLAHRRFRGRSVRPQICSICVNPRHLRAPMLPTSSANRRIPSATTSGDCAKLTRTHACCWEEGC